MGPVSRGLESKMLQVWGATPALTKWFAYLLIIVAAERLRYFRFDDYTCNGIVQELLQDYIGVFIRYQGLTR